MKWKSCCCCCPHIVLFCFASKEVCGSKQKTIFWLDRNCILFLFLFLRYVQNVKADFVLQCLQVSHVVDKYGFLSKMPLVQVNIPGCLGWFGYLSILIRIHEGLFESTWNSVHVWLHTDVFHSSKENNYIYDDFPCSSAIRSNLNLSSTSRLKCPIWSLNEAHCYVQPNITPSNRYNLHHEYITFVFYAF